jgi:hypothetical protein
MSSIKLTKTDLKTMDDHTDKMNQVDRQLINVRKQAIFQALSTATAARVSMINNVQKWLGEMEKKIFNPAFINDLNPAKAIALFKYINNLNLKALIETDKLEIVLNNYVQSGALELNAEMNKDNAKTADIKKLKGEIMEKLSGILKSNMSDAVVVDDDKAKIFETMDKELEPDDDKIPDDLPIIDTKDVEEKTMDELDAQLSKIDLD